MEVKEAVDAAIENAIKNFDGNYALDNPFENLISMGELVDRLGICNLKLFKLKDEAFKRQDVSKYVHESEKVAAEQAAQEWSNWAVVEDVRLCRERSRLKSCIDVKLSAMIARVVAGDSTGGSNPETKMYGSTVGTV